MSDRKVLKVIRVDDFLKYIRKKRVWVCFVCNGVDIHMICKKMIFDNTSVFVSENPELYGH